VKRQLPAPLSADERVSDSIARCSFRGCLSALSATFVKSIVDNAMFERTGKIRPSIWGQNPLEGSLLGRADAAIYVIILCFRIVPGHGITLIKLIRVNGVPVHVDIPLTSLTLPQKHPDRLVFCKRIELWKCLVPPSRKNLRCHQLHH